MGGTAGTRRQSDGCDPAAGITAATNGGREAIDSHYRCVQATGGDWHGPDVIGFETWLAMSPVSREGFMSLALANVQDRADKPQAMVFVASDAAGTW